MKRILYYALALAILGAMLYGCQIVLLTEPQKEDPSGQQNQTPDDDPKEEEDPILKVRTLGVYNMDGVDYSYRRGEWQLSRHYSADSRTIAFSMVNPENKTVYTVSGIKSSVSQVGHSIYLTFTAKTPEKELKSFSSTARVLKVSGDTLWLKSTQGPYYVIKK